MEAARNRAAAELEAAGLAIAEAQAAVAADRQAVESAVLVEDILAGRTREALPVADAQVALSQAQAIDQALADERRAQETKLRLQRSMRDQAAARIVYSSPGDRSAVRRIAGLLCADPWPAPDFSRDASARADAAAADGPVAGSHVARGR